MWHHILPGWLVPALYGILAIWVGAEKGMLFPLPLLAGMLLFVLAVCLWAEKHAKRMEAGSKAALPIAEGLLALLSGILLIVCGAQNGGGILLVMGIILAVLAGIFTLLAIVLNQNK